MKLAALIVTALLLLTGCGGGSSANDGPDDAPKAKPAIDSAKIQADFEEASGSPIEDMGDITTWHPYFDSIEDHNSMAVQVNLSTPGGYSDAELDKLAEKAGTDILNFTGEANPDLDYIVVYVNGQDRATIKRADLPLLN